MHMEHSRELSPPGTPTMTNDVVAFQITSESGLDSVVKVTVRL